MFHSPSTYRGFMPRSSFTAVALLALSLPLLLTGAGGSTKQTNNAKATAELKQQTSTRMANLPIYFEPNRGQTDPSVSYLANFGSTRMFLTRDSAVFVIQKAPLAAMERTPKSAPAPLMPPAIVRMRTVNSQRAQDEPFEKLPGISNYFIGNDAKKWVTDIPQYAKLKRTKVYPGVDMVFYGNQRQLEYDFIIAPGADPNRIELAYDGVDGIHTNANGDLVLATSAGDFIQKKPKVYQQFNGKQTEVAANYKIGTGKTVRFEVARYDRSKPLVIDPVIVFNALVGSSGNDVGFGIAIDSSQNTYVTGTSYSPDFPLVNAFNSAFPSSRRIVVFKLNAAGTALLYSTYIGGESNDNGIGIGVDSSGNAIIAGNTTSHQYPTVAAAQGAYGADLSSTNPNPGDGVVSKLSASGGALLYSTYLGGSGLDQTYAMAVDIGGNAYVVGYSNGSFPTTPGNFQPGGFGGSFDCTIAKYNPAGSQIYSSYLGGNDLDACFAVAADSAGNAYVTGFTQSSNFATSNGSLYSGAGDAFVAKVNSSGTALMYATLFGGSGTDDASGIAVDPQGAAYITGTTTTKNLATTPGAFQTSSRNSNGNVFTGFVAKLAPSGATFSYVTYLGGDQTDSPNGIAVDSAGNAYVVGQTYSANFPSVAPVMGTKPGGPNDIAGFATAVNSTGTALIYSTFLGGPGASGNQDPQGVVLDSSANAYIVGQTDSPFYKNTAGALNAGYGGLDIFVTKLSPSGGACIVSVAVSALTPYGTGASYPTEIFAPSGCSWTASPNQPWVTLSTSSATGSAPTTITVAANTGAARSTTIGFTTGQSITVNQGPGGCSYTFSPTSGAAPTGGGSGSASLNAGSGCTWNAVSNASWLTLSNSSGSANGSIGYTASANGTSAARSALITVSSGTFIVTQNSASGTTYTGYVDSASCSGISGWAADKNRLNTSIVVTLWDGVTQIASATANGSRSDVGGILGDNGLHAFSIPIPAGTANGVSHNLQLRYETSSTQVLGSPFALTGGSAGGANYAGYVDSASCNGISGWAADKNRLNTSIVVTLWDGGTQIASTTANGSRSDVGGVLGDNGLHGFSIPIPAGTANGVAHNLQIRYETSSTQLLGSPATLTCGAAGGTNYTGYVDSSSCSGISGWAADKNRLNTPIVVTLWDGGTQIASTTANGSRSDVGGVLGDNGLHGFSIPIPAGTANGATHTLQIRYETSASQLAGSPTNLTCGSSGSANFAGYVDSLSCTSFSGWAADKNALNTSLTVQFFDGGTLLGSTVANISRSDVGSLLGDNGLHGFVIGTPAGIKDGNTHTISVRPVGSLFVLPGAQTVTGCH